MIFSWDSIDFYTMYFYSDKVKVSFEQTSSKKEEEVDYGFQNYGETFT